MLYKLSAHFDENRQRAVDWFLKESPSDGAGVEGFGKERTMSSDLIGASPKFRAVLEAMEMVAPVDSAVTGIHTKGASINTP